MYLKKNAHNPIIENRMIKIKNRALTPNLLYNNVKNGAVPR